MKKALNVVNDLNGPKRTFLQVCMSIMTEVQVSNMLFYATLSSSSIDLFAEVFLTWPVESLAVGMVHHRCQPAGSVTSNETCEPSFTASLIMRAAVWLVSK
jgi:hypothetical protein